MSRPRTVALFASLASFGCASLEARTARQTGCEESEVVVSQAQGLFNKTWRATCGGTQYLCTHKPQQSTGVGGVSVTEKAQEHCVEVHDRPG